MCVCVCVCGGGCMLICQIRSIKCQIRPSPKKKKKSAKFVLDTLVFLTLFIYFF